MRILIFEERKTIAITEVDFSKNIIAYIQKNHLESEQGYSILSKIGQTYGFISLKHLLNKPTFTACSPQETVLKCSQEREILVFKDFKEFAHKVAFGHLYLK